MKLKNKNVLVVGIAKSGQSACEFLMTKKANVFIYDSNSKKCEQYLKTMPLQVKTSLIKYIETIDEELLKNIDYVIISPGVSVYNENIKLAKLLEIKVISELQLGLNYIKGKTIMVTGTNGKTTTVNMIEQTFNYAKKSNLLVGNVGNPITKYVSPFKTTYICEVSSFQLESSSVHPNIACILNLSENHLDRHFSKGEYFETKFKIFENMTSKDTLILNYDDENLNKLQSKRVDILGKKCKIKAKLKWISLSSEVCGAFVRDGKIYYKNNKKIEMIDKVDNVKILGEHNLYNILAMVVICKTCHIKNKYICETIKNFSGVEHRLEFVCDKSGTRFINDSKSATPQATLTALDAIKNPVILILGGSSKGLNYDDFATKIKDKIKFAVLTGEISEQLEKSFQKAKIKNYIVKKNFESAVKIATKKAEKGDVVLLSPATASFDEFDSFESRGKKFKQIVNDI